MEADAEKPMETPVRKNKGKKQYPYDFKTLFGFSTMCFAQAGGAVLYMYFFLIYLTDYAGIDQAIGKAGFAATLATSVLLIARIIDIVDDPFQGWVMDNAKWGRFGKYKKFAFLSVFLLVFSTIALFSIPHFVKADKVLVSVWVTLFYIMWEMGWAFASRGLLIQSITNDVALRAKFTNVPRIWEVLILLPFITVISIITAVNAKINNMGLAVTIVISTLMGLMGVISVIAVLLVKEGRIDAPAEEKKVRVSIKDIWNMLKMNRPMFVNIMATIFSGFTWSISTATLLYYIKYAYCFDPINGTVDAQRFSLLSGINGVMAVATNVLGAIVAPLVIKWFGDILKTIKIGFIGMAIISTSIFILHISGILGLAPVLFFILFFLQGFIMGILYVPQALISLETIDYVEFKMHRRMGGMVNSTGNVIAKAQGALNTVLVGGILVAIGYSVDASSGNYVGDLARVPTMLNSFMLISGLVPAILVLIAWATYHFFYPITPEKRKEMSTELAARRAAEQTELA